MTRVMIVEDEYLVRVGLRTCIDWEKHGLVLLDDAADGEDAYRQIVKNRPDILLLDLMIPKLDGFALMDKLAENGIRLNIIILSCCDDFESLRAALQRGVLDYVNKLTMSPAELLKVFEKALAAPRSRYPQELDEVNPSLDPSAALAEVILHGNTGPAPAVEPGYCACLVCLPGAGQPMPSAVIRQNMCLQILKNSGYSAGACVDKEERLCIALPAGTPQEKVAKLLTQHLEPTLDISCLIGFGPAYGDAEGLAASYRAACQIENELFWGRTSAVHAYTGQEGPAEEMERCFAACVRALSQGLSAVNPQACRQAVDTLFCHLEALPAVGREAYLQRLMPVLDLVSPRAAGKDAASYDNQAALLSARQAAQAQQVIGRGIDAYFEAAAFAERYSAIVQKSIEFIIANQQRTVRLDETAQAVNVSESYLSQLFKKDTGMNFVTYVQRYKINLAKQMLENHMRVYEVCDAIGFDNPNYFAKIFKRFTGVTPAEYRKAHSV